MTDLGTLAADSKVCFIRADADASMGTGHLMRCLALAQAWQASGGRATFLSHCESDFLNQLIERVGIDLIPLEKPHPDTCDLITTLSQLEKSNSPWLVIDGYHLDTSYQQAVRTAGFRLMVIDDIAHWPQYHANVLLNQNINAQDLTYRCDPDTQLLLGPQFVLLRPEFLSWRSWRREVPNTAHKVLVSMGGADPNNMTLKVIKAFQVLDIPSLEVRVVAGPANRNIFSLHQAVQTAICNIQLLTEVSDMAELMSWADVAVSAAGSTCWELALMGLPALLIILAENQAGIAHGLEEAGVAVNLGWCSQLSDSALAESLTSLIFDSAKRHNMSQKGRQLVDGYGQCRVLSALSHHAVPSLGPVDLQEQRG